MTRRVFNLEGRAHTVCQNSYMPLFVDELSNARKFVFWNRIQPLVCNAVSQRSVEK